MQKQLFYIAKYVLIAGVIVSLVISCSKIPSNIGKTHEVVVASSIIDTSLIFDNIQFYNYLPQKEGLFTFIFKSDTAAKQFSRYHTIFVYGTLGDEAISALLNDEAKQTTEKDTFTLFKLEDLWAQDQLVVIMAVSRRDHIKRGIEKYKNIITRILEEDYYQRIKTNYYFQKIDEKNKETLGHFGVTFDITKSWIIDSTYQDDNFLFFHIHNPDRSIFFYKEPFMYELSTAYAIAKRDTLTAKYYNGDYIMKDMITCEQIEFKGMRGMELKGVWQNDTLVAGGPFLSYFLTDADTLYILDGVLFNPGKRKSDYFTALEVIINSFQIVKQHPDEPE
jgi:hypothetical protein